MNPQPKYTWHNGRVCVHLTTIYDSENETIDLFDFDDLCEVLQEMHNMKDTPKEIEGGN